ncbi:hypothetical protein [Catellatospora methionotrophica]|uniref:hypothetical protein n=1 Tax=Catellatospora methionotrophica TaxID=121620 RepID=UPI0033F96E44
MGEVFARDARGAEADAAGHLLDRQVGGLQQFLGAVEPLGKQPGVRGDLWWRADGPADDPADDPASDGSAGSR